MKNPQRHGLLLSALNAFLGHFFCPSQRAWIFAHIQYFMLLDVYVERNVSFSEQLFQFRQWILRRNQIFLAICGVFKREFATYGPLFFA